MIFVGWLDDHPTARSKKSFGGNNMVTGRKMGQECCANRRHAAGCRQTGHCAFKEDHSVFKHLHGRVFKPAIGEPVIFLFKPSLRLLGIVVDIARGEKQRFACFTVF